MNILVTNDDGIFARGIKALVEALSDYGDVYVAAPNSQMSACGHGITVQDPVLVKEKEFVGAKKAWAVSGTPADCVKLAESMLVPEKIDIVVSGINRGGNLGTDVLYSGTVSGAVEGLLLGIPSVAISLNSQSSKDFEPSKKAMKKIFKYILENKMDSDTLLNINIPDIKEEEIKGVRVTKLGFREYTEAFQMREDPRGRNYYWYSGEPVVDKSGDETIDVSAVALGYISITPIHYDLTNFKILDDIRNWGIEI